MAGYIPNYQKKVDALRRKEQALRRLIQQEADVERLLVLALEVRDARVRALRAKRATVPPRFDKFGEDLDRWSAKIDVALNMPLESILEELRTQITAIRRHK